MKVPRFNSSVILFLSSIGAIAESLSTESTLLLRGATEPNVVVSNLDTALFTPDALPKGTADVLIDGKDGNPHIDLWVETDADGTGKIVEEVSLERIDPDRDSINYSNDGMMDNLDISRSKERTRRTEGGGTEIQEDNLSKETVPGISKEALSLSQIEQENVPTVDARMSEKEALKVLESYEDPDPTSPYQSRKNQRTVDIPGAARRVFGTSENDDNAKGNVESSFHSLLFSFTMIIFSEIGDKTFLVAALMAMRHPRLVVFFSAFSALSIMTILSALLGYAVPALIPSSFTKLLAGGLFLIFGLKMLKEGREMSPEEGMGEEMKEVEMELKQKEHHMRRQRSSVTPHSLESGYAGGLSESCSSTSRFPSPSRNSKRNIIMEALSGFFSLLLSPACVQTFTITFLSEWGDRSQIATITMAARQNYWWVTIGAISGHCICTATAVIGGRALAGKVSIRVVTLGGSVIFLVFGLTYLIEAMY